MGMTISGGSATGASSAPQPKPQPEPAPTPGPAPGQKTAYFQDSFDWQQKAQAAQSALDSSFQSRDGLPGTSELPRPQQLSPAAVVTGVGASFFGTLFQGAKDLFKGGWRGVPTNAARDIGHAAVKAAGTAADDWTGEQDGIQPATVWSLSQAAAGALDQAKLTGDYGEFDRLMSQIEWSREGPAYAPNSVPVGNPIPGQPPLHSFTGGAARYYDDNAWVGLDFMQAYRQTKDPKYLARAEEISGFNMKGLGPGGGLAWSEDKKYQNTCTNGSNVELALMCYQETHDARYLDFAKKMYGFCQSTLKDKDQLYFDGLQPGAKAPSGSKLAYNQGVMIGAGVLFYQVTGDRSYLTQAQATAHAELAQFARVGNTREPIESNVILMRNLMKLDAVAPDPAYHQAMVTYANYLWNDAQDPSTGLFSKGQRTFSANSQGAAEQLFALLGWGPGQGGDVA